MSNFKIFLRQDQINSDKKQAVYLRLIAQRKKKEFSLRIYVKENDWMTDKCRVKKTDPEHLRKNKLLTKYNNKALNIIDEFIINDKNMTVKDFELRFKNKLYGDVDFYKFVESELEKRKYVHETHKTYVTQLTKLKKFQKELKFTDLSMDFITAYKSYMENELKNKPNTWGKSLSMLKTFTN